MKLTPSDEKALANRAPAKHRRKEDPNSISARARAAGFNRMTYYRLLKKVEAGEMTMDEVANYKPKTRIECGRLAARKRWGGTR